MKKILTIVFLIVLLALGAFMIRSDRNARWAGVDETVVEHYALKAGHPARKPYINTDQGDLLLFLFLVAGATGGFIGGYCFRGIFPSKKSSPEEQNNV